MVQMAVTVVKAGKMIIQMTVAQILTTIAQNKPSLLREVVDQALVEDRAVESC